VAQLSTLGHLALMRYRLFFLLLVLLVGISACANHPSISATSAPPGKLVTIASFECNGYAGDRWKEILGLFDQAHIRCVLVGPAFYYISVPVEKKAEAVKLLKEEDKIHNYGFKFY